MADVTIDGTIGTSTGRGQRSVVFVSADVGYAFFSTTTQFVYRKTTDGGATWGARVAVHSPTAITVAFDVWFDPWTPGDGGKLIHTVCFDATTDDVVYRTLDTFDDTLGTQRVVFAGGSAVAGAGAFCSIAKMRGGNLYVAFDIDAGAEKGLRRSTDGGVNWTTRDTGTPIEATLDWVTLFPGNEADAQDCWMLYFDASANALTLKMHDDSAATTSESATIATVVENATDLTAQYPFAGSIRHSDGHLIVAAVTERDTATADHRVFDINGTGSITEKTAITTDIDDHYYPSVFIDQATDDIFVAFNGLRDGSQTLGTSSRVYYTKSTDGGANWTAGSTAYGETSEAVFQTFAPLMGERFGVAWRTGSTFKFNEVNSVTFSGGTNVTVSITGVSSASAAGALASTGGAMVDLSGVSATGSAGTVSAGSIENATAVLTSVAATGDAGALTVTGGAATTLAGIAAPGSAGTLTLRGDANTVVTGVGAQGTPGGVTVTAGATAQPAGVSASGQAGALTVAIEQPNITVLITGVSATGEAGTPGVAADSMSALQGTSASGAAGTATITGGASVTLLGVTVSGEAGTVTVTSVNPDVTVTLDGVQATGGVGTVYAGELEEAVEVMVPGLAAAPMRRPVVFGALRISGGGTVEIHGHQEADAVAEGQKFWLLVMAGESLRREKT